MSKSIAPYFGPGSGWYQAGRDAPGSAADRKGIAEAAIQCTIFVLYRRGQRMSPQEILLPRHRHTGHLVCLDRFTAPHWYACLFEGSDMRKEIARLLRARLERENNGVRLYGGIEVEDRGLVEHRQAFLAAPNEARGLEIVRSMLARSQIRDDAAP